MPFISGLSFLGTHARLCLPLGILVALLLPDMGSQIRHFVPYIIVMICLSHDRAGFMGGFERVTCPGASFKISASAWHTGVGALSVFHRAQRMGNFCLCWFVCVAPPIASTIWMPALGIQTGSGDGAGEADLLAPFTGPFLGNLFLTDVVPLNSFDLFVRLALMIIGGAGLAILGQLALGRQRITRNETAFDGLSTVAMLLFLIPVFNGTSTQIAADPYLAIQLLCLAVLVNFGSQLFMISTAFLFQQPHRRDSLSVMAVITGNRNVGLYYAALPYDPVMSLFTAMYQVPLYLTPLFLGWLSRRSTKDR